MAKNRFLDQLVKSRFKSDKDIRGIFDNEKRQRQAAKGPRYIKGVHNGTYYRIKVPPRDDQGRQILPNIPKLPQTLGNLKPFTTPSPTASATTAESSASTSVSSVASASTMTNTTTSTTAGADHAAISTEVIQSKKERFWDFANQFNAWWKENWAVLVLNLGSIASLVGFTRSDIVELRALSATGSVTSLVYHFSLSPRRIAPIIWSVIFTGVNSFKIYEIMTEREGSVEMTQEQESVYSKFFMPHGVTPRQFETIYNKAEIVHVKKGEHIVEEGQEMISVILVTHGETRAQTGLGMRRLTAASFKHHEETEDGAANRLAWTSGAWIGEIAFLERYWNKQQTKNVNTSAATKTKTQKPDKAAPARVAAEIEKQHDETSDAYDTAAMVSASTLPITTTSKPSKTPKTKEEGEALKSKPQALPPRKRTSGRRQAALHRSDIVSTGRSLYNIVAREDSTLMRWKHEDMEAVMATSNDMRGSMTRAMTAAIVGKVINFTVSRRTSQPTNTWSSWLLDRTAQDKDTQIKVATSTSSRASMDTEESPPGGPIKKFG
mmetsp:Transcript_19230/g.41331  ORF Transcript_19230/g.41331 Transcript_19230/m.41331 type:complete len:550 (-) Transcript_19230:1213-2862(-)